MTTGVAVRDDHVYEELRLGLEQAIRDWANPQNLRSAAAYVRSLGPMAWEDAEDIVQDAVVSVLGGVNASAPVAFWPWFRTVLERQYAQWVRHDTAQKRGGANKAARRVSLDTLLAAEQYDPGAMSDAAPRRPRSFMEMLQSMLPTERSAEEAAGAEQLMELVERFLATQEERKATIWVRVVMDGDTQEEVAADFGVSQQRISAIVRQINQRLRRQLAGLEALSLSSDSDLSSTPKSTRVLS